MPLRTLVPTGFLQLLTAFLHTSYSKVKKNKQKKTAAQFLLSRDLFYILCVGLNFLSPEPLGLKKYIHIDVMMSFHVCECFID